jgi:hypothetical protein
MERDNLWYYDYDLFGIRISPTLYLVRRFETQFFNFYTLQL